MKRKREREGDKDTERQREINITTATTQNEAGVQKGGRTIRGKDQTSHELTRAPPARRRGEARLAPQTWNLVLGCFLQRPVTHCTSTALHWFQSSAAARSACARNIRPCDASARVLRAGGDASARVLRVLRARARGRWSPFLSLDPRRGRRPALALAARPPRKPWRTSLRFGKLCGDRGGRCGALERAPGRLPTLPACAGAGAGGQIWAVVGPQWTNEIWSGIDPNLGRACANLARAPRAPRTQYRDQICREFDQSWPNLANFDQSRPGSGQLLTDSDHIWPEFGQMWVNRGGGTIILP